jgi:hypothetical protein
MRGARAAAAAVAAILGVGVVLPCGASPAAQEALGQSCAEMDESTFAAETVRDLRSYSDALAIVRGVKEEIPQAPEGPEGWAGFIGRVVTVRVERVLWRRPKAPEPPRTFRFTDWGWFGSLTERVPARVCGVTRMKIGRRYLAPIAKLRNSAWYPFDEARLRLRNRRVIGGVDGGEPNIAHNALIGRSIAGAVRTVAGTHPYRAVVRNPQLDPAARWQASDRDDYRVWREPPGAPYPVAGGATSRSRWELYLRLPNRGGMCVGLSARPLWAAPLGPSGEGCGPRRIAPTAVTLSGFSAHKRGAFAFGRAGERVATVRGRFADGEGFRTFTLPTPIPPGGRSRFWIAPARGDCPAATVRALDRRGHVLDQVSPPAPPPAPPGAPDPQLAC